MTATRVDFHTQVNDKIHYSCRLIRKARAANCRIIVLIDNQEQAKILDQALWSLSDADFLPHLMLNDPLARHTPILIATEINQDQELPHRDLLLNLSHQVPVNFAEFNRVIEVVAKEERDAAEARLRFRQYQQFGVKPSHTIASTT
ncbi:DNA polymerase III subunit chi [Undibacterium fentianense]|uniref:DNA polymerase III subunit chi n=1 Tax=Undibacterium fentianense TaxID=2828728 RepID=A0A941E7L6_9BURK|nr:DNA polymerase III subunit chi [Undibacterium fentianense]MBR7800168.1 DNA polymerase III subunit chi [Undibacterium fentianense]